MWQIKILHYDFYYIFYNFFIYSFFGWIYETVLVSFRNKKYVNRGFLNGPIIPIYGFGATIVFLLLYPIKKNIIIIFFGGLTLATILEYITSFIMECLFHAKWWDYSQMRYNIKGRICLSVSLLWGLLSVLMTEVMQPITTYLIKEMPEKIGTIIGYLILSVLFIDFTVTFISTLKLDKKLADIQKLRQELSDYLEGSKLYETKEEFKAKFENFKISEIIESIRMKLENEIAKHKDNTSSKESFDFIAKKVEIETKIKDILASYQKRTDGFHIIHKRLLNAFPDLRTRGRELALKDLKDKLHLKKGNKDSK